MGFAMGGGGLPMADFFAAPQHSHLKPATETRRIGGHGSPVSVSILDARYDDTVLPSHHTHHAAAALMGDPFAMSPYAAAAAAAVPSIGALDHRHHHHHFIGGTAARPNGFTHFR